MKLSKPDKVTNGERYEVELTRAEEVAELGEYAPTGRYGLPTGFDMENIEDMEEMIKKIKKVMGEENYDTMLLKKETYEEYIYFREEED